MSQPDVSTLLGGRSAASFFRDYWQKKPLLIRNAWPGLSPDISPEELAGLACEDDIHARLVQYRPEAPHWDVTYSPFNEHDFLSLPDNNWTLLVSDCEQHIPELQRLIQPFRFIPDWRIDDLMISYAADKGSVGPHIDQYDVFLLQIKGQREWQIEHQPRHHPVCIEHLELAILDQFSPDDCWTMQPGDLLYLPPGIPHHGIAEGPCMTASIGFRAPSRADSLRDYADHLATAFADDDRYEDSDLTTQASPAEITAEAIYKFRLLIKDSMNCNDRTFQQWLGEMLTASPVQSGNNLQADLHTDKNLYRRNPDTRMAYITSKHSILFFAGGQSFTFPSNLKKSVQQLCEQDQFQLNEFAHKKNQAWDEMIHTLVRQQRLIPDND